ncbi:hypothetical protein A0H81_05194 [Grifola frondosa]|uniref:Granulins domain-containing protein n=1 Tax=Grifola frondosa TaxID=5627 RepID=A0A1C7MCC1_GRIFR|nr:hypothetical protein A0H81_05194 [Grifola frondosa]
MKTVPTHLLFIVLAVIQLAIAASLSSGTSRPEHVAFSSGGLFADRAALYGYCPYGWGFCSATTCYPLDADCCSDGNYCPNGEYCVKGGGCCLNGEVCYGPPPPPITLPPPKPSTTFRTTHRTTTTTVHQTTTDSTSITFNPPDTTDPGFPSFTDPGTSPTTTPTGNSTSTASSSSTSPTGSTSLFNPIYPLVERCQSLVDMSKLGLLANLLLAFATATLLSA